ncbi:MAG: GNAT family N-acetyltransferase [Trinickia sp.]|uniref:GNAT family N-acetyltransferase n=1 Tax=Trinickia sp. TaxID=2571163 RepID=UPI003F7D880A
MSTLTNEYGQPIGAPQPGWSPRPLPSAVTLEGSYCRLEPLDPERHADDLYAAYRAAPDARDWTYLPVGPFDDPQVYRRHAEALARSTDPRHFAVIDRKTGKAVGSMALMRIEPAHGVVEVGHVAFSPLLKRTPISTEAQFLLMSYVFDELGYRRYEWKCDSLNAPSRAAAERLGFKFEGIFRQVVIYKGRSRDTAWFSILDKEWPVQKQAFKTWLSADNFDEQGGQRKSLADLRQMFA